MNNMPVSVKLIEYLSVRNLRDSSMKIVRRGFKWFIELFGDMDISDITFGHCEDFRSWLLKGRSESSANTYIRVMRPFFNWCTRRGYLKISPMMGIAEYKVNVRIFDTYKFDEVRKVLEFKCGNPLYRLAFCLGLCSMRESEILNLTISEVDIENSRIKVTPKTEEKAESWVWKIKDTQERFIGLPDFVLRMIIERIGEIDYPYLCLSKRHWQRNIERRNSGTITQENRNRPWGSFPRDFKNFLERVQVTPKRFQDSRKTFARNLIESQDEHFDIEMVREAMGHSTIQTTQIYLNNINKENLAVRSAKVVGKYYVTSPPL